MSGTLIGVQGTFDGAPISIDLYPSEDTLDFDSNFSVTAAQEAEFTSEYAQGDFEITFDATATTPEETVEFTGVYGFHDVYDNQIIFNGTYVSEEVISTAPCFVRGTRLAGIDRIDLAVEDVQPGDTLTLATGGTAEVVWVGRRRVTDTDVIRFLAGSLGDGLPVRELEVSCDHALYLDGVLVQAELLENKETILRERRQKVTFFHIELDQHGILLAEGAPAESYLDTGNRRQFSNCPMAWREELAAYCEPCAEMVFAGARLDAIKARLRALVLA